MSKIPFVCAIGDSPPVHLNCATTVNLDPEDHSVDTNIVEIIGVGEIHSFGVAVSPITKNITYPAGVTIKHLPPAITLLSGADRVTQAGDVQVISSDVTGNWTEQNYGSVDTQASADLAANLQAQITDVYKRTFGFNHVKNYGAVCDGTTDDTAAIIAAIAATPSGGTLYFSGTCKISGSGSEIILISNPIELVGAGQYEGGILVASGSTATDVFHVKTTGTIKGFAFRNLQVLPQSGAITALHLEGDIRNPVIRDSNFGGTVKIDGATRPLVEGNVFDAAGGALIVDGGTKPVIVANKFNQTATNTETNNSVLAIRGSTASVAGAVVRDNYFSISASVGNPFPIYLGTCTDALVTGNSFGLPASYAAIKIASGATRPHVKNNVIPSGSTITNASTTADIRLNPGYNPVGMQSLLTLVGSSTTTVVTAGSSPETHIVNSQATDTVTKNGVTITIANPAFMTIQLEPNESFTYVNNGVAISHYKDIH